MTDSTNPSNKNVTILIVEDSPTQAEKLMFLLEQQNYSVMVAGNGMQALDQIGTRLPTLVITDIVMPGMSGFELCSKIKSDEKTNNIPVVLLTSLSSTGDVLEGLACGADNFISKPYNDDYLLSNIANIIANLALRNNERVRVGVEIHFGGKKRFITADQQQMLGMLISTYEAAVIRNTELLEAQEELKTMNERLEELVEERTAQLMEEISMRKQADERDRLAREVLELLNDFEKSDLIHDIFKLVKTRTGLEAVGIRLKEGDDFPYMVTNGFPDDFVKAEQYLCERDAAGDVVRDSDGNPVLECMCGNVLMGRFDTKLPFFTEFGSFWTNSTTELLATTTEEDRQARTRNHCNGEGYESVALIPLRVADKIIGLIQFNDRRRDCFTLEMIRFFESLGASIGIALEQRRTHDEVREKLKELQRWYNATLDREDRVIEIKKEVNSLLHEMGKPGKYFDT